VDYNISVRPRESGKVTKDPHPQDYTAPDEEAAVEERGRCCCRRKR
jgi:hypothetical protein